VVGKVVATMRVASMVAAGAFAAATAAMVVTPLRPRGRRAGAASVTVAGLAVTTTALAARRWGWARALQAAAGVTTLTLAVERTGVSTGVPFGRYGYTGRLRPAFAGVPVIVPAAWFALALPARETGHAILGRRSRPFSRTLLGAACLTAWDLFLDPQMTAEGYWSWRRHGRYRGIPGTNFAGWMATSAVVLASLERGVPTRPGEPDTALVGVYAFMAVMSTLGHACFFGDPLVAAVGGAAMVPPAVLALRRCRHW